jgi:hypothetical protein
MAAVFSTPFPPAVSEITETVDVIRKTDLRLSRAGAGSPRILHNYYWL